MTSELRKRGLGKGLSALLGDDEAALAQLDRVRSAKTVPIEMLYPGRFQPRRTMPDDDLSTLAASIADKGILQPILVRRHPDDANAYEIIAGERRWRAAQMAQLDDVPVVIKDLDDRAACEIALVENLQRQDLSALDEAEGYRRLLDEFDHTQEDLARSVGKSRSHVANMLRLLGLPERVRALLDQGALTAGHARALVGVPDAVALAEKIVKRGLNVRQTEAMVKANGGDAARPQRVDKDPDTRAIERDLSERLGLNVEIKLRRRGGALVLHYRSLAQLDDILHRLNQGRAVAPETPDDAPPPRPSEMLEDLIEVEAEIERGLGSDDIASLADEPLWPANVRSD
ncbi:MAG: ParB/RepB/Spo0J family partition protein [Rhodospirillales bacterium]|nr:MAG: ParB/RepB/Spo0J family partition protein [Rhodospirillales bacterium]